MPARKLKVLCVHGLGDHRSGEWETIWEESIRQTFPASNRELDIQFLNYDDIFESVDLSPFEIASAVNKLLMSALFGPTRQRGIASGIDNIRSAIRWTAGYVVAWVSDRAFQRKTRKRVLKAINDFSPDLLLAHSLGSLITYNALSHPDSAELSRKLARMTYVSFGSQLGNAFVIRNLTFGRIQKLSVKWWFHLYNRHDDVFTEPLNLPDIDNFLQVNCHENLPDSIADHAAEIYLEHPETTYNVYLPFAQSSASLMNIESVARSYSVRSEADKDAPQSKNKAFLCGINAYPTESDRLYGCVNDVYLMNELLQDCGFSETDIRLLLDERATADRIMERLEWLVKNARPGDNLIFYYSGHGTQVASYGEFERVDILDECLVPVDFDYDKRETWILDDHIYHLYSQLPYGTRLVLIFDCCHSGDIYRNGGRVARGLVPPADIRHRMMKWDRASGRWESRELKEVSENFSRRKQVRQEYFGKNCATRKFGRAAALRQIEDKDYRSEKAKYKTPVGPYMPLVITSCDEDEKALEYSVGSQSFGAFTYHLNKVIRENEKLSFEGLVDTTAEVLSSIGFGQSPKVFGPESVKKAVVPFDYQDQ
ncbi:MAG: caspase family protein [Pseudomonadales bacterium]|nr:caspase family protein [Pseudomonadales bacterium]